jgi:hypothetical protein
MMFNQNRDISGPQITVLIQDKKFDSQISEVENAA